MNRRSFLTGGPCFIRLWFDRQARSSLFDHAAREIIDTLLKQINVSAYLVLAHNNGDTVAQEL